jgi:hypothetical protein
MTNPDYQGRTSLTGESEGERNDAYPFFEEDRNWDTCHGVSFAYSM